MKLLKKWMFLFILTVLFSCTEKSNSTSENDTSNDDIAIAESVKALNNALVNPEEARFDELVMDELSYGHSTGSIQNKEELIDDLINGPFDFQSIDISDQTIDIIGNTALVRHILSAKAESAGNPVEIQIGIFLVYQSQNGQWKLLARQAYKL